RQAAGDLVLDLAGGSAEVLAQLVAQAQHGAAEERIRAVMGVQALAQAHARLAAVERAGAVDVLVAAMRQTQERELAARSAMALADVLGGEGERAERRRARAVRQHKLAEALGEVLGRAREPADGVVVAVCVMLARQCALDAGLHGELVAGGVLPGLLAAARHAAADVEQLRAAMEAAVRLCTHVSASGGTDALSALADEGAAQVVGMCVRHDDQGVASWGIGLLHELASRGVARAELAAQPRLVRALCRRLATGKYAYTNQLVLRSLWCLCASNGRALLDAVAEPRNLRRVLGVFAAGAAADDVEAQYWAVALVSRAATLPRTHQWILLSPLAFALDALVHVDGDARSLRATLLPEIAALIARLTHEPATADCLATVPHVARACVHLLRGRDVEQAAVSTAMALVRSAATSQPFVRVLSADTDAGWALRGMAADSAYPGAQAYALKALAALRCVEGAVALDEAAWFAARAYVRKLLRAGRRDLRKLFALPHAEGSASDAALGDTDAWKQRLACASVAVSITCTRANDPSIAMADEDVREDAQRVAALQTQLAAVVAGCLVHALAISVAVAGCDEPDVDRDLDEFDDEEIDGRRLAHACIAGFVRAYYGVDNDDCLNKEWLSVVEQQKHVRGLMLENSGIGRARGFLATAEPALLALAEALADAGAAMQDAQAARLVVSIMRIMYHELPPRMRALAVRVVAAVPPQALSAADNDGVARMCADLLWPTANSDPYSEETAYTGDSSWLEPVVQVIGGSTDACTQPLDLYYTVNPVLVPPSLAMMGFVHARLALDQRIAPALPSGALLRPADTNCIVLGDGRTVWNSGWRFSSVRAAQGFCGRQGGVHTYEVQLLSSGLMQVGWCTEQCEFFPASGEGVGDDKESLAYDGFRRRRWHASVAAEDNAYGERWRVGDVVAAELDLDNGRAVFYRNGRSMGVAIERPIWSADTRPTVKRDRTWYPAFSFAGEQGLVFLGFGRDNPPVYRVERISDTADAKEDDKKEEGEDDGKDEKESKEADVDDKEQEGVDASEVRVECLNDCSVYTNGTLAQCSLHLTFDPQGTDPSGMPCVSLPLPAGLGELLVGVRSCDDALQWCVVHALCPPPADRQDQVAGRFMRALEDAETTRKELLAVPRECHGMTVSFSVIVVGYVLVRVVADEFACTGVVMNVAGSRVSQSVWAAAANPDEYLWLPTVGPSVSSFSLEHLSSA
ncbi:hypothetical protein GGI05_001213, partial [Coemansia sp. RSA 2603]